MESQLIQCTFAFGQADLYAFSALASHFFKSAFVCIFRGELWNHKCLLPIRSVEKNAVDKGAVAGARFRVAVNVGLES